ncbi:MAG: TIGR01212 family radical SAM protein [Muribaculaceae bacterium]|nr:TIGR01212 family radical SAM protein [Muribaculaceae bacterium]
MRKSYSDYLVGVFPGIKVQKISVNAGRSCPNRDGTIGRGGCIYCDNRSFTPAYCMQPDSVKEQIEAGKEFFSRKYPEMKYLAYFQSYTNTYGADITNLERLYREAMDCEGIVGIVIGTRPDTLPDSVIELLARLNREKPIFLEIGAESTCDDTLRLINRGHTWNCTEDAVRRAAAAGLRCGLHLIAGLPGEDDEQVIRNVEKACALPIDTLKLHQLQIIKGTPLHRAWEEGAIDVKPYSLERYLNLCVRISRMVPENIVLERFLAQAPPGMVVAPKWGLKNYQFMNLLHNALKDK